MSVVSYPKNKLKTKNKTKQNKKGQAPVAYTCNPSYSEGKDQEDHSLKLARANRSRDPISKIPNTKRAGGVAQDEGPEFKPKHCKNKKKGWGYNSSGKRPA
jgi:hypothetical protein